MKTVNTVVANLIREIRAEFASQESRSMSINDKQRRYYDIAKNVLADYIKPSQKKSVLQALPIAKGIITGTPTYFTNVNEACLLNGMLNSVLVVSDKDGFVWKLFNALKQGRIEAKKAHDRELAGAYKIAINTAFIPLSSNKFAHLGTSFDDVKKEFTRRIKDVVMQIKDSGATILAVNIDSILYSGAPVVIDGVHNENARSAIVMPNCGYICYDSMPFSKVTVYNGKLTEKLKKHSDKIIDELFADA